MRKMSENFKNNHEKLRKKLPKKLKKAIVIAHPHYCVYVHSGEIAVEVPVEDEEETAKELKAGIQSASNKYEEKVS